MDVTRLLLALALLAVCGLGAFLLRRRSPLHPVLLALGTTALIGSFYPLFSLVVPVYSWRHALDAPPEMLHGVQLEFVIYAAALLGAFLFLRGRDAQTAEPIVVEPRPGPAYLRHRARLVPLGLVLVGLALYGLYVAQVGFDALSDRSNFALKYRESSGLGPLVAGLHLAILGCFWAEASPSTRPGARRLYRLIALAIAAWSLGVIAQRTNVVILALGYAVIHCELRGMQLRRVRPALVLGFAALWVGAELFGVARATWDQGLDRTLETLSSLREEQADSLGAMIGGSELAHPVFTSLELRQVERAGALGGRSFFDAPLTLVPLALHADRPETLAQGFVTENYPLLAARGGGAAFSHLGEAWWNFGPLLGPLLLGLVSGALHAIWDRTVRRRSWGLAAMLLPYLASHVAILHRYESATFLKQTLSVALPAACVLAAAHLLWAGTGRRVRASAAEGAAR